MEKAGWLGEAEAEDALFYVADAEEIRVVVADAFAADEAEDGVLYGIDVLILIDEDVAILLVERTGQEGWSRGIAIAQDIESAALEVGEIEGAVGVLGCGIFFAEIFYEG